MNSTHEPTSPLPIPPHIDRRDTLRKACRVRAVFDVGGQAQFIGKTLDISHTGISLVLPQALQQGCVGVLRFSIFVNGNLEHLHARAEVVNCVFLSADVRLGFRFIELDPSSKRALALLMR